MVNNFLRCLNIENLHLLKPQSQPLWKPSDELLWFYQRVVTTGLKWHFLVSSFSSYFSLSRAAAREVLLEVLNYIQLNQTLRRSDLRPNWFRF